MRPTLAMESQLVLHGKVLLLGNFPEFLFSYGLLPSRLQSVIYVSLEGELSVSNLLNDAMWPSSPSVRLDPSNRLILQNPRIPNVSELLIVCRSRWT